MSPQFHDNIFTIIILIESLKIRKISQTGPRQLQLAFIMLVLDPVSVSLRLIFKSSLSNKIVLLLNLPPLSPSFIRCPGEGGEAGYKLLVLYVRKQALFIEPTQSGESQHQPFILSSWETHAAKRYHPSFPRYFKRLFSLPCAKR